MACYSLGKCGMRRPKEANKAISGELNHRKTVGNSCQREPKMGICDDCRCAFLRELIMPRSARRVPHSTYWATVAFESVQNGPDKGCNSVSESIHLPPPESRKVLGRHVDAQIFQRLRAEVAVEGPLNAGAGVVPLGVRLDAVHSDAHNLPEELANLVFRVPVLAGELKYTRECRVIRCVQILDRDI
jgi:hypothetical protein